jgi:hypothetical protein
MKEVLRKLGLVANWSVLGGLGILFTGAGLFVDGTQDELNLGLGVALLVMAFIVHKILNWIFN